MFSALRSSKFTSEDIEIREVDNDRKSNTVSSTTDAVFNPSSTLEIKRA